jgi:hypothetical protein
MGAENITPTGIRSPDHPSRCESLYRLSYPGQLAETCRVLKNELMFFSTLQMCLAVFKIHFNKLQMCLTVFKTYFNKLQMCLVVFKIHINKLQMCVAVFKIHSHIFSK